MFPFQLPWDDASESVTNISWLNDKPAGRDGFVHVKDGHLFAGEKRLRIFGVNTCFAANFPDKAMAPKVAARMAKFGINCVRFHHMDMMSAPGGIFAKDGRTLDPGQLDKLDFFIAELKKNGIYADLNLHVSRTYPDRPRAEKKGNPDFDKGVDNFCAAMIALQKDYARDLLTHVNAYTGNRYADEPAVALVEINNENAFGFQWWAGQMDDLPKPYREELESLWAAWILKKHGSDEAARKAWSAGAEPLGAELIDSDFDKKDTAWTLEKHGDAQADGRVGIVPDDFVQKTFGAATHNGWNKPGNAVSTMTVGVAKTGTEPWHVQFHHAKLNVESGRTYTLSFFAKSDAARKISVNVGQTHEPWKVLWSTQASLTTEWKHFEFSFRPSEGDKSARLTFSNLAAETGACSFADVSLRSGGVDGSLVRDTAQRIPIVHKRDLARTTPAKQRDWQEFIWDTETAYWNGMRDFLKKDLGVKVPIVGTQGFWSPGHVQAGMDVIDSHAYWHHPDFHGKGWNPDVWDVKNEPMAGAPDGGTLPGLAAQRVAGKPFLCTEYNHPAPNTYSAETFPLLCAFAALQDWDGVFAFSYSHRAGDAWSQEHFDNFFDIDRHPVKMATLPGAAISFRRGDLEHLLYGREFEIGRTISWLKILNRGPGMGGPSTFFDPLVAMNSSVGIRPIPQERDKEVYLGAEERGFLGPQLWAIMHRRNGEGIVWNTGKHSVTADAPRLRLAVGRFNPGESSKIDDVTIVSGATRQAWACFQFSVLDRDSTFRTGFSAARLPNFATAKHILITATGDIENTGMGWKNAAKTSVGRDWGKAPVLVEGPAAKIELLEFLGGGKFKAWALDERGQRRAEIPVANGTLEIGPQHRTLWYEVERQ
jgi:hypothetical protein